MLIERFFEKKRSGGVVECYMKAVMKMYEEVLSQVKMEGEDSKEFAVRVGIHQGSILSPLIFDVVMDVVTEEAAREGRALMYADDLVLICETKEEARQRFVAWRNMDPCSVCGKRVGVNSIHCATCGYWVHGRCSGVRGSLARVPQGFLCVQNVQRCMEKGS